MYHGGVAGDEETVVRKMRVGQLDGALLTSTGLGALVPQVLVLQAPGLITSYPALDDVRKELGPQLEKLFVKAGYALISWGDSGQVRIFSKHRVQHPDDLRQVRPWVWRGSPTMRAFIEAAGANGVTMGLPEVFSALQTGMVDTVIASSIGVLGFQWHTRLATMTKPGGGIVVGAYVIRQDRLDALPKAARDHIINSAREHAEEFREGGRKLDDEASAALAKRLKSVNLWRNQHAWEAVQRTARNLAGIPLRRRRRPHIHRPTWRRTRYRLVRARTSPRCTGRRHPRHPSLYPPSRHRSLPLSPLAPTREPQLT
jgi:TRAP-type C4-dicarboxylate transport system substrate-binding protein